MLGVDGVVVAFLALLAGLAIGLWYGETRKTEMLKNLLAYGSPWAQKAGHTIVPETAEVRLDRDAETIQREYTKATIAQGVADLKALYKSEGAAVPSDKVLEAEVKDMLGRAGTTDAGVPSG